MLCMTIESFDTIGHDSITKRVYVYVCAVYDTVKCSDTYSWP